MTKTAGPYSPIRKAGNFYFTSGQIGIGPDGNTSADIADQTRQALDNLAYVLTENGLSLQDVIKTTVFLKNIDDFGAVNEVYARYFTDPKPARSCVAVAALPRAASHELLIELEAVAYMENV